VRPTAIYGPYDPTERQNYWIERIDRFDRIVIPGEDDRTPIPLGYVEDVAQAIRLLVERGEPGEAYNVASRSTPTIDDFVGHVADVLDTRVTVAHASRRDLASVGLNAGEFPFCRETPYVVSTEKLASLGWESTPFEIGVERAVTDYLDRRPDWNGPSRETEERLLAALGDPRSLGST
jgi:nucleoside-diphosphate-sugar epimerase